MGLNYSLQLIMSGVLNVTQLVGVITSLWTMDRFGRRPLLLWGSFFMTLSHLIIAILVGKFSNNWPVHRTAGWVSVAFLLFYMLSFGASWGPVSPLPLMFAFPCRDTVWKVALDAKRLSPHARLADRFLPPGFEPRTLTPNFEQVPWAMPSEIFPSSLRAKGVALATCSNWLNNFIIGLITPPLVINTGFGAVRRSSEIPFPSCQIPCEILNGVMLTQDCASIRFLLSSVCCH